MRLIALILLISSTLYAQVRIDSDFSFLTNPAKKYSIYVPASYNPTVDNKLMVGFHPFNTTRWDAKSWCDTLVAFAESNDLILVCPDGGSNGRVDDPIDTAFTSVLIDSMLLWYAIDSKKIYAMGFSVGGKATYTYGLNHVYRFGGFIPIGAAINGTTDVNQRLQLKSKDKPFYLVHGTGDTPNARFYPIRDALVANGALVNDTLMPGVGHTIDFPDRNNILSRAYQWVDSVNCSQLDTIKNDTTTSIGFQTTLYGLKAIYPTKLSKGSDVHVSISLKGAQNIKTELFNLEGVEVKTINYNGKLGANHYTVKCTGLESGIYLMKITTGKEAASRRIIIL